MCGAARVDSRAECSRWRVDKIIHRAFLAPRTLLVPLNGHVVPIQSEYFQGRIKGRRKV